MSDHKIDYNRILKNLMLNWMATYAVPTAIIFAGRWIPHTWLPFVTAAFIPLLIAYGKVIAKGDAGACALTRRYTEYALGVSALIMIFINLADTRFGSSILGLQPHGGEIPFVPAVVLYPTLAFFTIIQLGRIGKTEYCKACASRSHSTAETTAVKGIYDTQTRYLSRISIVILVFTSIVMLVYFFTSYINVNYNASDTFFFFVFPVAVFFLSTTFIYMRYQSLRFGMAALGVAVEHKAVLHARYLVVKGDRMLLSETYTQIPGMTFWDTPAVCDIRDREMISEAEASDYFKEISGAGSFTVRSLYHVFDDSAKDDISVFAVFLPDDAVSPGLEGEWLNLYAIDRLYNAGLLTAAMSYDVRRIYVITMAWKCYTPEGRRLYPIRNYRPTFQLSDFKNWDVDYNDQRWFDVYEINEDRPFWRLRKFWRRYVSGTSTKFGR